MHADTGPSTSGDTPLDEINLTDIHLPVNIGNPVEFTVAELAERVLRMTGSASRIERKPLPVRPLPVDDPKVRKPNVTRARALSAGSQRCRSSRAWSARSRTLDTS